MGSDEKRSKLDEWRMPIELRVDGHYRLHTVPLREVLQAIFADPEMRKLIGTAIMEAPINAKQEKQEQSDGKE